MTRAAHNTRPPRTALAASLACALLAACSQEPNDAPLPEIVLTDSNPGRDVSPGSIRKPAARSARLSPEQAGADGGRELTLDLTPVSRSDEHWRAALTPETYAVTRLAQTEKPGSGRYLHHDAPGFYRCACCAAPLFASEAKYDSGSGWPAFWGPVDPRIIEQRPDESLGLQRTEVRCARCQAHLGHLFPGGPEPTGLWYCINSAALDFQPDVDLAPP